MRLRPQMRQAFTCLDLPGTIKLHEPEATRIVKRHHCPALHAKHDMVMLGTGSCIMQESIKASPGNREPPGHAQMHDQGLAR